MKHLFFALFTGLALTACSTISTDPAPARVTRTAQAVTITYNLTPSTIASDTLLQGARIDVYTLTPTTNADGTLSYPAITAATTPAFSSTTVTPTPQSFAISTTPITVAENTPNLGLRIVLRTTNRPGRRTNSQRLTASLLINGSSKATLNHTGTNFARTASPVGGFFTTTLDTNVAAYTF